MENVINGTPKATFYLNELACELAELFIEMKYEGKDVSLYDIEQDEDENGEINYTEEIQDEYNEVYDRIETYLFSNQIK
jgi:hypothetical protein